MDNNLIVCSFCNREFSTRSGLGYHIKRCKLNPNSIKVVQPTQECPICGNLISKSNFKKHYNACGSKKVTQQDHKKNLICRYCGKQYKDAGNLAQHENKFCKENPYITDETREKVHQKYVETYYKIKELHPKCGFFSPHSWNKGLTKDTDDRILKSAQTLSKVVRQKRESGIFDSPVCLPGWKHSETAKEKMSNSRKQGIKNGSITPNTSYKYLSCRIRFKDGTIKVLRSSYEIIFALFLDFYKIKFDYETIRVPYIGYDKKSHVAISDFLVGSNTVFEIKGKSGPKDDLKLHAFKQNGYEIRLVTSELIDCMKQTLIENNINIDKILKDVKSANEEKSKLVIDLHI